jgi:hypothetical protein
MPAKPWLGRHIAPAFLLTAYLPLFLFCSDEDHLDHVSSEVKGLGIKLLPIIIPQKTNPEEQI